MIGNPEGFVFKQLQNLSCCFHCHLPYSQQVDIDPISQYVVQHYFALTFHGSIKKFQSFRVLKWNVNSYTR